MYGDTGVLSFQLDMYRWEDHLRRMQDIRQQSAEQDQMELVVSQYNDLVQRYNALGEAGQKTKLALDAAQGKITSLLTGAASKDAEINRLNEKLFETEQGRAVTSNYLQRAIKSEEDYMARALAAEAELKALRSQKA